MLSKFKAALIRLVGGDVSEATVAPAVEFHRIKDLYQTAGTIEKDTPGEEHKFVRADTHGRLDDAISFTIAKGKQLIDQQGQTVSSRE